MHTCFLQEKLTYDGSQLSSHWIFQRLGVIGDGIVSFRGPCRVDLHAMVDLADVRDMSPISSEDMLHFIVEHFELDLEKAVLRQRFLIVLISEELRKRGIAVLRSGDDLYCDGRKLSVSIATLTPVSCVIHTGVNISAQNTPVPAAGLLDLGLGEGDWPELAGCIMRAYSEEMNGIHLARCKVRGVG